MQLYGQLNPGKPVPGFSNILSTMVKRDGIFSVYKGVDAAIGRQMVYGTARIGLHRTFSDYLVQRNDGKPINFLTKTLSGMASGSIAVCIGTPFDIALVRLQSDSMEAPENRRNYKNVFDVSIRLYCARHVALFSSLNLIHCDITLFQFLQAFIRTTKEEGVGALYKGLGPNILRGMSMNVGMLACYDQAKEVVSKVLNDPMTDGPRLTTKIGSSAVAGFTAALFSLPFDLIKSRLMAQKPDMNGKLPYSGIADCAVKIFKKEGPAGFFAGFSAYYGRCAPHAMIILLSIESITQGYRNAFIK
jgi:solute carrier family 25 oxoglutarate transporter 11